MSAARTTLSLLAPPLAAGAVQVLAHTLRISVSGTESLHALWRDGTPVIYAMWHGHVLLGPWVNARLRRTEGARPVAVLASRSRDGDLAARFAARFGVGTIRGSSSRGGAAALRRLATGLARGEDVVVVPDGPRGPRWRVQPGVVMLAAISGAPVVPMAVGARPATRLSSWDEFLLPWPFARCAVVFGEPLWIAAGDDREAARQRVERALAAVTSTADRTVAA